MLIIKLLIKYAIAKIRSNYCLKVYENICGKN